MENYYLSDWDGVMERFVRWWSRETIGHPLMKVVARGKEPARGLIPAPDFKTVPEKYLDIEKKVAQFKNFCETRWFMADAFPSFSADLGPGSFALYVGSEPVFAEDTVWFSETMKDINDQSNIVYDGNNKWLAAHLEMYKKARELAEDKFLLNIPDIVEDIDILAALRGPQNLCYDIMDDPAGVKKALAKLGAIYFKYYDAFYDIVKLQDGSSSYTAFAIWGPGKTAKVQCDFNVMLSPAQFREFALPGIAEQCSKLTNTIFHVDGPDALKHAPAIAEIKDLHALQWTCGAGQPDGGCEKWFGMYDTAVGAGKSLWLAINEGDSKNWAKSAERLVKRYGPDRLYLTFPEFESKEDAEEFIEAVKGFSK